MVHTTFFFPGRHLFGLLLLFACYCMNSALGLFVFLRVSKRRALKGISLSLPSKGEIKEGIWGMDILGLIGVSGDLGFAFHNTHNHNILTQSHTTPTYTNQDGDEVKMKLKQALMRKSEE